MGLIGNGIDGRSEIEYRVPRVEVIVNHFPFNLGEIYSNQFAQGECNSVGAGAIAQGMHTRSLDRVHTLSFLEVS